MKREFLGIYVSMMLLLIAQSSAKTPKWCWTKPNFTIKYEKNIKGINYALCEGQEPAKEGQEEES